MAEFPCRKRVRRIEGISHVRFLTFSCYQRSALLRNDGIRQLLADRLGVVTRELDIALLAWVIMPEYMHLLVFPNGDTTMAQFMLSLKRPVAEVVLRQWRKLNALILEGVTHGTGHRFWQAGGG